MAVAGLDVIVVERGEPGRDKVCGDGLTPSAVTELALMGVDTTGWRRNKGGWFVFDSARLSLRTLREAIQNAGFTVEPLRPEKVDDQEHRMLAALAGQKRDVIRIMLFALPLLLLSMGHMWGMPLPRTLDPAHTPC